MRHNIDRMEEKTFAPYIEALGEASSQGQTYVMRDASGEEMERFHYTTDGQLTYRQITFRTYEPDGILFVQQWLFKPDGSLSSRLEGRMYSPGRIKSQIYYSAEGHIIDRQEYEYDDEKNTVHIRRWNATGRQIEGE